MSVATSTAIALGAAATAGGTVAASKLSSGAAKTAAADQTSAANYAADAQSKSNAATLDFQKQQAAADQARQDAAQRANYAQYLTHYNAVQGLGSQMGMSLPDAPSYESAYGSSATGAPAPAGSGDATLPATPTVPGATTTTPGAASGSSSADVQAYMLGQLKAGVDPKTVADQTNAKFGSSIGTGALYYPSNNTIGLPNFYLAGPQAGQTGGWNVVPRQGGSATPAPTATSASSVLPNAINAFVPAGGLPALQQPTAFRLGPGSSPFGGSA